MCCIVLPVMGNQLLTTGDIADRLGVDRSTVHRRILARGIYPTMTVGRTRLYPSEVVHQIKEDA